jgi:hypothetical protein
MRWLKRSAAAASFRSDVGGHPRSLAAALAVDWPGLAGDEDGR